MQYDRASMDHIADQIASGYKTHDTKMVNEAIDSMFELHQYHKQCQEKSYCDGITGPALNELSKQLRKDGILKEDEAILNWDPTHHNFMLYDSSTGRVETMTSRDPNKRFDARTGAAVSPEAGHQQPGSDAAKQRQEENNRQRQQQLDRDRAKLQQEREAMARKEEELRQREQQHEQELARQRQEEEQRRQREREERERRP